MAVSVVVGGQYGSEGKGKVTHWLAQERNAKFAIRVGGSNSGHTVIDPSGNPRVFRHLPTACLLPKTVSVIAPGSYIDPDVLIAELTTTNATPDTLIIDQNAVVIDARHKRIESDTGLTGRIGSTGSGTGAAVADRINRQSDLRFAGEIDALAPFVRDSAAILRRVLDRNERVVIEGTQGFGLSVLHSGHFPYSTSRDTSAAAFVSEAGLSPRDVDEVVMVLRAFPIRVAGDSGPFPKETGWAEITQCSGSKRPLLERTTVTQKVRRVARFDAEIVRRAISVNRPDCIVLNHVDYFDASIFGKSSLSQKAQKSISHIERLIERPVDFFGAHPASIWRWTQSDDLTQAV